MVGNGRSGRRLDAAARRASIIEAATSVFARAGYDQARVSDIARRLGVTEPVVFQNFGTKAKLFSAVLERVSAELAADLTERAAEEGDAFEGLSRLFSPPHIEHLHSSGQVGVLLAEAATGRIPEECLPAARGAIARTVEALTEIMRKGQVSGSLRDDVAPETLTWLVLSLVNASGFRRDHGGSAEREQELLRAVLRPPFDSRPPPSS